MVSEQREVDKSLPDIGVVKNPKIPLDEIRIPKTITQYKQGVKVTTPWKSSSSRKFDSIQYDSMDSIGSMMI